MELKDGNDVEEELDRAVIEELGEDVNVKVLIHALHPRNMGILEDPDGDATLSGICEDTVRIQCRLQNDRITDIRFMTNGCAATVACASVITELASGKNLQEAMKISDRKVIEALGGLPIEYTHCATLTANALKAALVEAIETKRAPWKKIYRKRQDL